MKLVMVMCAGEHLEDVRKIIDDHEVHGYTEIPNVLGSGQTGRRLGTRAWPGISSIIFSVVAPEKADALMEALSEFSRSCSPGEGARALILPVERML